MRIFLLVLLQVLAIASFAQQSSTKAPEMYLGNFADDYGIEYSVTDSLFILQPKDKYHIVSWDTVQQFIIARNDISNPGEGGLYTRIDYMNFSGMEPFQWGFCLTTYKEKSALKARKHKPADRIHPKEGCNGYPFSRMKRIEP